MAEENMEQVLDDLGMQELPAETAVTAEALDEAALSEPAAEPKPETKSEPGYIKGRIDKAIAKARAEWQAEMDAKIAPLLELQNERDAQALVDAGMVTDLEVAKELVRLRRGNRAAEPASEKPKQKRDESGRFASKSSAEPAVEARASLLVEQANKIKSRTGVDVMAAYNANESIKAKVLGGEWDFYDVAESLNEKKVPSPISTPNGGRVSATAVSRMSDAQFAKLNENLASGKRYDMRE